MFKIDFKDQITIEAYYSNSGIFAGYEVVENNINPATEEGIIILKRNDVYLCILEISSGIEAGYFAREEELETITTTWLIDWFSYETTADAAYNFFIDEGELDIFDFEIDSFAFEDEDLNEELGTILFAKKDDVFGLITQDTGVLSKNEHLIKDLFNKLQEKEPILG